MSEMSWAEKSDRAARSGQHSYARVCAARARRGHPQTSFEAAATWTSQKLSLTKQRVLALLREFGAMTHEEMYERWRDKCATEGWPPLKEQSVRSRCSELRDVGLVEDSGVTRKLRDGNNGTVWRTK
jgi:hypothetical protein